MSSESSIAAPPAPQNKSSSLGRTISHLPRCRGPRAPGRGTPSRLALLLIFQADAAIFIYVSIDMDIAARKLAP